MRGMRGMLLQLRLLLLNYPVPVPVPVPFPNYLSASYGPLFVRLHQAVDDHELDTLALGCDEGYHQGEGTIELGYHQG